MCNCDEIFTLSWSYDANVSKRLAEKFRLKNEDLLFWKTDGVIWSWKNVVLSWGSEKRQHTDQKGVRKDTRWNVNVFSLRHNKRHEKLIDNLRPCFIQKANAPFWKKENFFYFVSSKTGPVCLMTLIFYVAFQNWAYVFYVRLYRMAFM